MKLYKKLRNSDIGTLVRKEYWRYRGKREYEKLGDYGLICKNYLKLGRELNLKNPQRYTEKLQWLKLFYRDERMPICSDKYLVRRYLIDNEFGYLLNDLIASYTNVDDLNVDSLPKSFVIKASHGSAWNLIVRDKNEINWKIWKKIMRSWMKQDLSWFGAEWNYAGLTPRIIVEKYLEDDSGELRDYKIICTNGVPRFMQIDENRATDHKRVYVDENGNSIPMDDNQHSNHPKIVFGENQKKMFELAAALSKDFPNVRVDFYECNDRIIFGEMTFFGGSGFYSFTPDEWDYHWGKLLELPEPNYNLELYRILANN